MDVDVCNDNANDIDKHYDGYDDDDDDDEATHDNVMIADPVLRHLFIDVWELYVKEVKFLQLKGVNTLIKLSSIRFATIEAWENEDEDLYGVLREIELFLKYCIVTKPSSSSLLTLCNKSW